MTAITTCCACGQPLPRASAELAAAMCPRCGAQQTAATGSAWSEAPPPSVYPAPQFQDGVYAVRAAPSPSGCLIVSIVIGAVALAIVLFLFGAALFFAIVLFKPAPPPSPLKATAEQAPTPPPAKNAPPEIPSEPAR